MASHSLSYKYIQILQVSEVHTFGANIIFLLNYR